MHAISTLRRRVHLSCVSAALLLTMSACGGGSSEPSNGAATVTLAPATLTLAPGAASTLTATVLRADGEPVFRPRITWSSSNETVATVAAGQVQAVGDGTATITATVGGVSGTAAVTVAAPVSSVRITPTTLSLRPGGTPTQLNAEALNATGGVLPGRTFEWSSGTPAVATVSTTGLVTPVAVGTSIITARIGAVSATATVSVSADACSTSDVIAFGQVVSSTLTPADCRLSDSTAIKRYRLTVTAPTRVDIVMTSAAVDAYLFLTDSALTVLDQDDDGEGGTNAKITRLLQPGRYEILANTFAPNTFGAFQLTVRAASGACATGRTTAVPSTTNGTLAAATSCRLEDGSFEDRYDIRLTSRANLRIDLTSTAIDPLLVVVDSADNVVVQDDDGGVGLNSRAEVLLEPGRYTVLARGFPGQVGAYQLVMSAVVDPCGVNRTLAVPQTVSGTFATTDCALTDGGGPARFLQRYALTLTGTASIQLDMASSVVDAYLLLQNATTGAVLLENDDAGAGTTNARITANLPAGQYIVNATTFEAGEVGAYTLTASGIVAAGVGLTVTPTSVSLAPGQTQQATSTVTGTANTAVRWQSSAPTIASVSDLGLIRALTPGTATITVTSQADPARTATVAVTVTGTATNPNLDIAALYLVQSVQQLDGRVPLIADRAAVARVFLRGSRTGLAAAGVRVRIFQGSTLLGTFTGSAVPTLTVDESCCSANVAIPASVMRAGISVLADVDPDNTVTEANETDNSFPLSGMAQALSVTAVPAMNVRFVPVQQNRGGATGVANNSLLTFFRSMWPLSTINVTVRAPLVIDYAIGSENFDDWIRLVRDVEVARTADRSTAYYYGLVRTTGTRGVLGLANGIPARTAIGIDEGTPFGAAQSQLTFAHEMGHVLGLRHSPCGNAAGPEPTYPFPDGRTGAYGMDTFAGNAIKAPTLSDVMSYCEPQWVSAFNYRKVFDYRQTTAGTSAPAAAAPVVLISGSVVSGAVTLDPAFSLDASPATQSAAGRMELTAYGDDNRVLFTWRFNPYRVSDATEGAEAFVVAVPVPVETQLRIARLTVRDRANAGTAARTRAVTSAAGASPVALSVARTSSDRLQLSWSPATVPGIMVRHRATGQIVAIARNGTLNLAQFGRPDELEVYQSNGVTSTTRTFSATGAVLP
jgi:uncharacterized protein YjdB